MLHRRELAVAGADAAPDRLLPAVVERPRLLAPLPRPGKLLFCGVNYASHRDENPGALPTVPFFFSKLPTAIIGPGERIVIPAPETRLD